MDHGHAMSMGGATRLLHLLQLLAMVHHCLQYQFYDFILLTVYNRVKVQVDLQADKSPVVVKGPFFPRVVNPRYRICGTNV
jgi:hypothetical protein